MSKRGLYLFVSVAVRVSEQSLTCQGAERRRCSPKRVTFPLLQLIFRPSRHRSCPRSAAKKGSIISVSAVQICLYYLKGRTNNIYGLLTGTNGTLHRIRYFSLLLRTYTPLIGIFEGIFGISPFGCLLFIIIYSKPLTKTQMFCSGLLTHWHILNVDNNS